MTPSVIIATHQRREITTRNIELLLKQSFQPMIVIVVSDIEELEYYSDINGIIPTMAPNNPLGAKWQAGINYIRPLNPSHVIITGSDDILCKDFVRRMCTSAPFTGLQKWYIFSPETGMLYLFDYLAKQCLGGGRIYTSALLDSYDWQVFNTRANKLLDDAGWALTSPLNRRIISDEGCILAVKGAWVVMNPIGITLDHKNAKMVGKWQGVEARAILKDKFNYEV